MKGERLPTSWVRRRYGEGLWEGAMQAIGFADAPKSDCRRCGTLSANGTAQSGIAPRAAPLWGDCLWQCAQARSRLDWNVENERKRCESIM